ncbi:MAG: 7-cyano-7-deazaguanine synthase [Patescibacteria group bacterium]
MNNSKEKRGKSFVLISGGPDSKTLLNEVIRTNVPSGIETQAIFINFGQPYLLQELTSARLVATNCRVLLNEIIVPGLSHAFVGTGEFGYIIFRNVIEASYGIAASFARYHGAERLYHANIKEDVDDLPWMPEFFKRLSDMVNVIEDTSQLSIMSPYLSTPKAEVFEHASEMGVKLSDSWSCLTPGKTHCGVCRSCLRRKNAFKAAGLKDETIYNE